MRVLQGRARAVAVAVGIALCVVAFAQLFIPVGSAQVGTTTRDCGWAFVMLAPSEPARGETSAEAELENRCEDLRGRRFAVGGGFGVLGVLLIVMPFVKRLD